MALALSPAKRLVFPSACNLQARKRAEDSDVSLGSWRDMAVISREVGKHEASERCWLSALDVVKAAARVRVMVGAVVRV